MVLQSRLVPKELRQFVPNNLLADGGASSLSVHLRPSTFEGARETAALASQGLDSTGIRLSNN